MYEKTYIVFDDCKISVDAFGVELRFRDNKYAYDEKEKPKFDEGTGEVVTEYTGLIADKNSEYSWAKAVIDPKKSSKPHLHKERTEDYYIISGEATITIDGNTRTYKVGDHIKISPNQVHHVINHAVSEKLVIIVKCVPAWSIHDYHIVNTPKNTIASERSISPPKN